MRIMRGDENLTGTEDNDYLTELDGNDTLSGLGGSDTLEGGNGHDWLDGGMDADLLYGGDGDDTYVVDDGGDNPEENAYEGTDTVLAYVSYNLDNNFENLTFMGSGDVGGYGNRIGNIILGNSGRNHLIGGVSNDHIDGGDGDDSLDGRGGGNLLTGGAGADQLYYSNTRFVVRNDRLTVTGDAFLSRPADLTASVTVSGTVTEQNGYGGLMRRYDSVILFGSDGDLGSGYGVQIYRGDQNYSDSAVILLLDQRDIVILRLPFQFGASVDFSVSLETDGTVHGTVGSDGQSFNFDFGPRAVLFDAQTVSIQQDGADTRSPTITQPTFDNLVITSSAGTFSDDFNRADGAPGNGWSSDPVSSLDGGGDEDTAYLDLSLETRNIVFDGVAAGAADGHALADGTLVSNVETFWLTSGAGDDSLSGGAGNDTLSGGAGHDTLTGDGPEVETVVFQPGPEGRDVWISSLYDYEDDYGVDNGALKIGGWGDTYQSLLHFDLSHLDLPGQVVSATMRLYNMDHGTGSALAMYIDELHTDWDESYGWGDYALDYTNITTTDPIGLGWFELEITDQVNGWLADPSSNFGLLFRPVTNWNTFNHFASSDGEGIYESLRPQLVLSFDTPPVPAGDDWLDGGVGVDVMRGGGGNDTYVVDDARDTVEESVDAGTDTVRSVVDYDLTDNVENLYLDGTADIGGRGNDFANMITGNGGSNAVYGGSGGDTLYGGAGNDILVGDGDADGELATYVFQPGPEGQDVWISSLYAYESDYGVDNGALKVGGWGDTYNSLLRFDLEPLVFPGEVVSATLRLYNMDHGTGSALAMYVDKVNTTWDETYGWHQYALNYTQVTTTGAVGLGWFELDVSELVDDWLADPSSNFGLQFRPVTNWNTFNHFASSDGEGIYEALRPQLVLTYVVPEDGIPETSAPAAADTLTGGTGNDTYWVNHSDDVVIETAGEGTDTVYSFITYQLAAHVEHLVLAGAASVGGKGNTLANRVTGNDGDNTLDGVGGADTLNGGAGHDSLIGAAGNDSLVGGPGNDTYYVDDTADKVAELNGEGTDLILSAVSYNLTGRYVETLTLTGTGHINATGNSVANALNGTAGNNVMDGGAGNDTMAGGLGNDTYYVQAAGDKVIENGGEGTDTIFSTISYSLNARYVEVLTLTGSANVNATGNSLANTLNGNAGNNTLNGKGGKDSLSGGLGSDVFLFEGASGKDTISDFSATQNDTINIHAYTLGSTNAAMVVQSGANVVIDLGGGNTITVLNATQTDVLGHMVW